MYNVLEVFLTLTILCMISLNYLLNLYTMKNTINFKSQIILLIFLLAFTTGFAQKKTKTIKVLSYNIHVGNPPSQPGVKNLEEIARVINESDADLVALQEIDVFTKRSGKDIHQSEVLAELTNRHHFFAKAIDYSGGEYGIAVLSKFPIKETKRHQLPKAEGVKGEQRALAVITVEVEEGVYVDFASTHLDLKKESRILQTEFISDLFRNSENSVIVAGDFNASPKSNEMKKLGKHFKISSIKNGFTFPVVKPNVEIDYIMYAPKRRFKVKSHRVVQEHFPSDHLPLFVELEMRVK